MFVLIVAGSIVIPLLMVAAHRKSVRSRYVFHSTAVLTALVFGNIAAIAVYKVIRDQSVFMTSIHAVFLNPFFLISGAYLGMFLLYRLVLLTMRSKDV